jgi:hypothetical protein
VAYEVLLRKLNYLRKLLTDLEPLRTATLEQVLAEHDKVERLFELLVMALVIFSFTCWLNRALRPSRIGMALRVPLKLGCCRLTWLNGYRQQRPCATCLSISMISMKRSIM